MDWPPPAMAFGPGNSLGVPLLSTENGEGDVPISPEEVRQFIWATRVQALEDQVLTLTNRVAALEVPWWHRWAARIRAWFQAFME